MRHLLHGIFGGKDYWYGPRNEAQRNTHVLENQCWKELRSKRGSNSRVQFASDSFKLVPMFFDRGPPSQVALYIVTLNTIWVVTPPRRMNISLRMKCCWGFLGANQGTLFMEMLWHPFGADYGMENEFMRSIYWICWLYRHRSRQQQIIAEKKSKRSKSAAAERWKTGVEV